jgi:SAM-dependent methyltransferase
MEANGPNAEQIEYWNKQAGPKWVADVEQLDAMLAPLGLAAVERAAPKPGERVIDVGPGLGQTLLQLAERVGPTGSVLGVDISTPMLEGARARLRAAGVTHVTLQNADAQTHSFAPASFDLVFSRFGVMFFVDPVAAFANLAKALRPGGRVTFVCWQALAKNVWMTEPLAAVAKHVPLPPPGDPHAPGPFAFADSERVRGILERAGLRNAGFESLTGDIRIGKDLDQATLIASEVGAASRVLREATESARKAAIAEIRATLAPRVTANGVSLPYAAWIVTGTR